MIGQARDRPDVLRQAAAYLESTGDGPAPAVCKLRIIDPDPVGRPPRTVRFATAVTVRVDGYLVQVTPGKTTTVVSASGCYEIVPDPRAVDDG